MTPLLKLRQNEGLEKSRPSSFQGEKKVCLDSGLEPKQTGLIPKVYSDYWLQRSLTRLAAPAQSDRRAAATGLLSKTSTARPCLVALVSAETASSPSQASLIAHSLVSVETRESARRLAPVLTLPSSGSFVSDETKVGSTPHVGGIDAEAPRSEGLVSDETELLNDGVTLRVAIDPAVSVETSAWLARKDTSVTAGSSAPIFTPLSADLLATARRSDSSCGFVSSETNLVTHPDSPTDRMPKVSEASVSNETSRHGTKDGKTRVSPGSNPVRPRTSCADLGPAHESAAAHALAAVFVSTETSPPNGDATAHTKVPGNGCGRSVSSETDSADGQLADGPVMGSNDPFVSDETRLTLSWRTLTADVYPRGQIQLVSSETSPRQKRIRGWRAVARSRVNHLLTSKTEEAVLSDGAWPIHSRTLVSSETNRVFCCYAGDLDRPVFAQSAFVSDETARTASLIPQGPNAAPAEFVSTETKHRSGASRGQGIRRLVSVETSLRTECLALEIASSSAWIGLASSETRRSTRNRPWMKGQGLVSDETGSLRCLNGDVSEKSDNTSGKYSFDSDKSESTTGRHPTKDRGYRRLRTPCDSMHNKGSMLKAARTAAQIATGPSRVWIPRPSSAMAPQVQRLAAGAKPTMSGSPTTSGVRVMT